MSGQVTTSGSRLFLKSFFGKRGYLIPDQLWIALVATTEPTVMTSGSDLDEIDNTVYPSYDRAQFQNVEDNWLISGFDTIYNSQAVEFPVAGESWGEINYFAICDSRTGGDVMAFGDLAKRQEVIQGDRCQIEIGGISFTIFNPVYEGD